MATKTRKTIGTNPLDAVIPDIRALKAPTTSSSAEATPGSPTGNETTSALSALQEDDEVFERKERLTIHLSAGLINRVKNAVFWTPGLTLADMGEEALTQFVDELESKRGTPFEQRTTELKGGRPIKRT